MLITLTHPLSIVVTLSPAVPPLDADNTNPSSIHICVTPITNPPHTQPSAGSNLCNFPPIEFILHLQLIEHKWLQCASLHGYSLSDLSVALSVMAQRMKYLTLKPHILSSVSLHFFQLYCICCTHKLSSPAAKTIVYSIIAFHLDSIDSTLAASQTVTYLNCNLPKIRKFDQITSILKELHSLPICQRILFKILILTHKGLHNPTPSYSTALLIPYTPPGPWGHHQSHCAPSPNITLCLRCLCLLTLSISIINYPLTPPRPPPLLLFKSKFKVFQYISAFNQ